MLDPVVGAHLLGVGDQHRGEAHRQPLPHVVPGTPQHPPLAPAPLQPVDVEHDATAEQPQERDDGRVCGIAQQHVTRPTGHDEMDRRQDCVDHGVEVLAPDRRQGDQSDTAPLAPGRGEVAPAVDGDRDARLDEVQGELLGERLEAAVVRRDATRAQDRDPLRPPARHRLGPLRTPPGHRSPEPHQRNPLQVGDRGDLSVQVEGPRSDQDLDVVAGQGPGQAPDLSGVEVRRYEQAVHSHLSHPCGCLSRPEALGDDPGDHERCTRRPRQVSDESLHGWGVTENRVRLERDPQRYEGTPRAGDQRSVRDQPCDDAGEHETDPGEARPSRRC